MKTIITIIIAILLIDFLFFTMWVFTNQTPQTKVYPGAITANIIKLII